MGRVKTIKKKIPADYCAGLMLDMPSGVYMRRSAALLAGLADKCFVEVSRADGCNTVVRQLFHVVRGCSLLLDAYIYLDHDTLRYLEVDLDAPLRLRPTDLTLSVP